MKSIFNNKNTYVLRIDKSEDVIETLIQFCAEYNISAAYFSGIGAAAEVTLSYYDLTNKVYEDHILHEDVEIVRLTGNLAQMRDELIVHAHGVFAKRDLTTIGGHIKKLVISATCEIVLTTVSGSLNRLKDEETGLNLLTE